MGLMIDTMCNGVGGLVLVAILIVLISIGESPSSAEGQMQRKQMENEVQALKIQEELLVSEIERMSENRMASGDEVLESITEDQIAEQLALIASKKQRVQDLEKRREQLKREQAQVLLADPGEYVATEMEVYNRLQEEAVELEAQLRDAEQDLEAKESNYSELLTLVKAIKEQRSRTLSVPKERKYSRSDFIYFRYGKCYTQAREDSFSPDSSFRVIRSNNISIDFEPKSGSGISLDSTEMRNFLTFVKRKGGTCQLGFYPDSFHLFLPMKQLLDEFGLALGVNFYTDSAPPGFTLVDGIEILGQGE